jgi:hypothetical protein
VDVIFAPGNPLEPANAVPAAMTEILQRWDTINNPQAYARRAPISNLIKSEQRGLHRIQVRLVQRGDVPRLAETDHAKAATIPGRRSDERQRPGT